ncbi:MAG: hypothetical protein JSS72_05670 [Armatimonadetes bacterium]|nr:hypothetical protein [Armatimonadota bacterium]
MRIHFLSGSINRVVKDPGVLSEFVRQRASQVTWRASIHHQALRIELMSQVWQDIPWMHEVTVTLPENTTRDTALLMITGGDPNEVDLAVEAELSRLTEMPVGTLYHIPNQPLLEGRYEDDLIAETIEEALRTGDPTWLLLMPMAASVVSAMDAIQEATDGQISRFVVTGHSKRGWTAWLSAATGDPRIVGIAPQVFDNLNFPRQMEHQRLSWGEYSGKIADYTSRDLPDRAAQEAELQALSDLIDPYSYLPLINIPVLIVNGANDPYWAVDALSLYFHDIRGPKAACVISNAGHDVVTHPDGLAAVAAFARSCARDFEFPNLHFSLTGDAFSIKASSPDCEPLDHFKWFAASDTKVFHESAWQATPANGAFVATFEGVRFSPPVGPEFTLTTYARLLG